MLTQLKALWRKLTLTIKNRNNIYRCRMLDVAMDFARHNLVNGDYFEFGCYAGRTFQYAYHAARDRGLKDMRFHALDSFEGFSEPKGADDMGMIAEGTRNCSEEQFMKNVTSAGVPANVVTTTKGWFADTLEGAGKKKTDKQLGDAKIAVAWMDADLYEPTISALNFLTDRLQDGSVLIFDNWFLFKGNPDAGERRALTEWHKKNPHITLTPFYNVSWHGSSFIVSLPVKEGSKS